jgi:hypothetical protein
MRFVYRKDGLILVPKEAVPGLLSLLGLPDLDVDVCLEMSEDQIMEKWQWARDFVERHFRETGDWMDRTTVGAFFEAARKGFAVKE